MSNAFPLAMFGKLLSSILLLFFLGCERRQVPREQLNGVDSSSTGAVDTLPGQTMTEPTETLKHKGIHQLEWERHRAESLLKDTSTAEFERGYEAGLSANWAEAAEIFERITREHPENSKAYYNLGLCYEYLRDYSAARRAFERAYELHPDSLSRFELQKVELWERELQKDK